MPRPKNQRNEFAEMYVAGVFADRGWSIYFPREDKGFDFIITKFVKDSVLIRPVQVKGKYPETMTAQRAAYGYQGNLTALHHEMVLAIPFFTSGERRPSPVCIAYLPRTKITQKKSDRYVCLPAQLKVGEPSPRPSFKSFFDEAGLDQVELGIWGN